MTFQIPENIAPENYPLVWLLGSWRGAGVLSYSGIEPAGYLHELTLQNIGSSPFVEVTSTVWLAQQDAGVVDKEVPGSAMYEELTKGDVWSSTVGFVRAVPGVAKHGDATILEATSAQPSGYALTWAGYIQGPQMKMAADAIASTPAATANLQGQQLMVGLVNSDVFYALDMAAFGHEMATYMAGRLSRVQVNDGSSFRTKA
ncbi:MAG: heme-binding beta-barrel domain-containing protein [Actinomycetaceae bacterium]|nr:heme-binding beta-barrel domain-containing protein [Actinomycetaceae bacterium]MDY6083521.1 heme-binding beta-barrel domain-containing protein [Actinomycetaceae bacterium]